MGMLWHVFVWLSHVMSVRATSSSIRKTMWSEDVRLHWMGNWGGDGHGVLACPGYCDPRVGIPGVWKTQVSGTFRSKTYWTSQFLITGHAYNMTDYQRAVYFNEKIQISITRWFVNGCMNNKWTQFMEKWWNILGEPVLLYKRMCSKRINDIDHLL